MKKLQGKKARVRAEAEQKQVNEGHDNEPAANILDQGRDEDLLFD